MLSPDNLHTLANAKISHSFAQSAHMDRAWTSRLTPSGCLQDPWEPVDTDPLRSTSLTSDNQRPLSRGPRDSQP